MDKIYINIIAILMSIGVFLSPLYPLIILLFVICAVDLVTAIGRDWKNSKIKNFWEKVVLVKSRKLRRSSTKVICYWIIVGLIFLIFKICLIDSNLAIWLARVATFMLSINELYSIAENMKILTGKNIFVKIIRAVVKSTVGKFNENLNLKIEDKLEIED
jgi:hypothetical protein